MARDIANNIVFNNGGTFTFIIQENYSPLTFSIIAPADSSIIDTSFVTFLWHRAIDSDDDDIVFYDVEL